MAMRITNYSNRFTRSGKAALGMMKNYTSSSDIYSLASQSQLNRTSGYKALVRSNYSTKSYKTKTSTNTTNIIDSNKVNNQIKSKADALQSDAMKLVATGSKSLFNSKAENKDVYDAVDNFVSSYNTTVKALQDSEDSTVLKQGVALTETTKLYKENLTTVGISINENNRLELDKEMFMSADMKDIKKVFNGSGSYALKAALNAQKISASSQISIGYTKQGKVNYSSRSTYSNKA